MENLISQIAPHAGQIGGLLVAIVVLFWYTRPAARPSPTRPWATRSTATSAADARITRVIAGREFSLTAAQWRAIIGYAPASARTSAELDAIDRGALDAPSQETLAAEVAWAIQALDIDR